MRLITLADTRRFRLALVALVALPIAVAAISAALGDWMPVGDDGLLILRVDDVGSKHHPWLGSWTSASLSLGEELNNPGAWYAYLLAPFVAIFGPVSGAALAVGVLNTLALVGIGWAASCWGGSRAAISTLAATAGLCWAMGSELLIDVWQPHALLLVALLTLVLSAGVADGRASFLPWFAGVASLLLQTHLGHAYLVAIVTLVTLAHGAVRRVDSLRAGMRPILRARWLYWTIGVLIVAWLPALIEQVQYGSDGNLAALFGSIGGNDSAVGLRQATRVIGQVFVAPWSRSNFADAITPDGSNDGLVIPGLMPTWLALGVLIVLGLLALGLARWAKGRGLQSLRSGLHMALASMIATVVALSLMPVGLLVGAHQLRWTFAVGIFVHAVLLWGGVEWVRARRTALDFTPAVAALAVVLAAATLVPYAHDHGPVADRWARPTLHAVRAELKELEIPDPVLFDTNHRLFDPYSGSVMMLMGERNIDFRTVDAWVGQLGPARALDGSEIGRIYQLDGAVALHHVTEDCRLLEVDGVSDEERKEVRAAVDQLTNDLLDGTIVLDEPSLAGTEAYEYLYGGHPARSLGRAEWTVLSGVLNAWAADGLVDPATMSRLSVDGPRIDEWVRTVFALYLETTGPCPG